MRKGEIPSSFLFLEDDALSGIGSTSFKTKIVEVDDIVGDETIYGMSVYANIEGIPTIVYHGGTDKYRYAIINGVYTRAFAYASSGKINVIYTD